jgi:DNA replication protein DnaC
MLAEQTVGKLKSLRLLGMLQSYQDQLGLPQVNTMGFDERFGLIVDREELEREDKKFSVRLKKAKLRESACLENIKTDESRGINKSLILNFKNHEWIKRTQNILITGLTGVGKTYFACALLHEACISGYSSRYFRLPRLLEELAIAKADGTYPKVMDGLAKIQVLLLDDWGLSVFTEEQRRLVLEIVEDRYGRRSTIITSQVPVDQWYEIIGESTIADAIMDRIINGAYKINLKGPSWRGKNSELTEK